MNEFKGTKGEWRSYKPFDSNGYVYVDSEHTALGGLATCYGGSLGNEEEANYNALLISKAPEMLESLNEITSTFTDEELSQCIPSFAEKIKKAKKLIKEATTL